MYIDCKCDRDRLKEKLEAIIHKKAHQGIRVPTHNTYVVLEAWFTCNDYKGNGPFQSI